MSGGPTADLPLYTPSSAGSGSGRNPAKLLGLLVGAVALVGASVFAVVALTRPDGADSPEGAVRQMFGAIEHEDALGVIESLPPGERKVLRDPLVDTSKELQRLGILKKLSLSDIPGADLQVDDLQLSSTTIGDGVVAVDVTGGTISGTSIPEDFPIGDALQKVIDDGGGNVSSQSDTFSEDLSENPLHLVAIKEGGGWHVSLAYSLAESIRNSSDDGGTIPPPPNFGHGVTPVGATSPEEAVTGMVDAAVNLDAEKAITLTDPEEMRALYDYAPMFLPDLLQSARDAKAEGDVPIKIDRIDTRVDGDGSVRRVRLTGFDITVGDAENNAHVVYDGSCYDTTSTSTQYFVAVGQAVDSSDPSSLFAPAEDADTRPPEVSGEPETRTEHHRSCVGDTATESSDGSSSALDDLGFLGAASSEPFGITVTEVDGRWYVSPVRTVLDSMVEALRALEPGDIDQWVDEFGSSDEEGSGSFEPVSPAESIPTTTSTAPPVTEPPVTEPPTGPLPAGPVPSAPVTPVVELFPTSSGAVQEMVVAKCPGVLRTFDQVRSVPGQNRLTYLAAAKTVYGCAAGVIPIQSCMTSLDQEIAAVQAGSDPTADETAFRACITAKTQ